MARHLRPLLAALVGLALLPLGAAIRDTLAAPATTVADGARHSVQREHGHQWLLAGVRLPGWEQQETPVLASAGPAGPPPPAGVALAGYHRDRPPAPHHGSAPTGRAPPATAA